MAIQMRRGPWSQFDPTKMLPGEWAVILSGHPDTSNGQALYHCFAAGSVKQIATIEDAATIIANATEDIRDELTQDIASALAQVGAATNAANTATANANTATSAANAATQAATSASERAEDAIEAMGDISELAVPLMSPDVRGGAKLEEHGGLALRDGALGIGSLVQESDGYARGGLAQVTAKGHAEQVSTTGKNLLPNTATSQTINGITFTANADGSVTCNGTATDNTVLYIVQGFSISAGTYTLSGCPSGGSSNTYRLDFYYDNLQQVIIDNGTGGTATLSNTTVLSRIRIQSGYTCNNLTFYPMLRLASITDDTYEPYTGAAPSPSPEFPQTIEVVRGRNLLPNTATSQTVNGVTFTVNADGSVTANGTATGSTSIVIGMLVADAGTYTFSGCPSGGSSERYRMNFIDSDGTFVPNSFDTGGGATFTLSEQTTIRAIVRFGSGVTASNFTFYPQLVKGSTPQPYVPYGHVGMEVRDPDTDELVSCTALPLPQRGWVAGLPDGTADSLRLDGAGKCEWELADAETTTAATDGVTGTIGVDVLSTTGQIADGATVLYKLATPVTEDCGYVDMPAISSDAQISIPELDALGIRYFVDDSVTQYGREIYARVRSEYEDRLEALEEAMATIITGS